MDVGFESAELKVDDGRVVVVGGRVRVKPVRAGKLSFTLRNFHSTSDASLGTLAELLDIT